MSHHSEYNTEIHETENGIEFRVYRFLMLEGRLQRSRIGKPARTHVEVERLLSGDGCDEPYLVPYVDLRDC